MADFDSKIRESQDQVAKAQSKITEITNRIEIGPRQDRGRRGRD